MSESNTKPNFSLAQATDVLARLYDLAATEIRPLPSYGDQNFYISSNSNEYVLKILNTEDSANSVLTEVQNYAMSTLQQSGFPTQTVIPTNTGQLWSIQEQDCGFGRQKYLVRLLSYLPGITISKVPLTPQMLYEMGKMAAKIDKVLQEMKHPNISVLDRDDFIGKLSNIPLLEDYLFVLNGEPIQEVVKSIMRLFKSSVAPKYSYFRKSIIQGDLNENNILVQPDGNDSFKISGILDFGDMSSGYYVHELAVVIMHMMTVHPNPIEVGGAVLRGWESELPLNEAERECLYALVLSRFCQTVCCVRHSLFMQPDNEYLMMWSKKVDRVLLDVWNLSKEQVEEVWSHGAESSS